jgi:CheY-like chemotaxis protein
MLGRLGHTVTLAGDGEEALRILASTTFDAIFMDVQLPGIDGLEVTRRFRNTSRQTPVIGVTAHTSREDRDRCLAAGMTSVLTKPVLPQQLEAALGPVPHPESIAQITSGNPALLARVRDAFARQTPELLDGIRDALVHGDAEALARHAHKLKGSLSYFEGEAAGLARDVELAARGADLVRAASLLPDLEIAVAVVADRLHYLEG